MNIDRLFVVGVGTMSNGMAQVCALAGMEVSLIDVSGAALERAPPTIEKNPFNAKRPKRRSTVENSDMSHRLSQITTKTGDTGETSLAGGTRVGKNSPYVCALGAVDEVNSMLGLLMSKVVDPDIQRVIATVQNDLFDLGAELCQPGKLVLSSESVDYVGQEIERFNAGLPPLAEFLLPGGSEPAAICHIARTTCGSAERAIVSLEQIDPIASSARVPYLNRLSDLLFVLAQVLNRHAGVAEVYWPSTAGRTTRVGST